MDVYGSTSIHDDFWKCKSQCRYRANCPIKRKLAIDAVKMGATIKLEEVRDGDHVEKAYYDVCLTRTPIPSSIRSPVYSMYESSSKSWI